MKGSKIVSLILVLIFFALVSGLCACGSTDFSSEEPEYNAEEDAAGGEGEEEPEKETGAFTPTELTAEEVNSFSEEYVNLYGRTYIEGNTLMLDHAATAIEFGIYGSELDASISCNNPLYICVYVDDAFSCRYALERTIKRYNLLSALKDGYHKIRIVRSSESTDGAMGIIGVYADRFFTVPKKSELKIEFIGDSITAGYGIRGAGNGARTIENSDATLSYAFVAASELDADYSIVAVPGICVKAQMWTNITMDDVYKKISTRNGADYAFDFDPDVVIINLGGNDAAYMWEKDGSYALRFSDDYYGFLLYVLERNPSAYVICIHGMMGADARVLNGINKAVRNMACDRVFIFDDYVPDTSAANGHPCAAAQETWGKALAKYINRLIAENGSL